MEGVTFTLLCLFLVYVVGELVLNVQPDIIDLNNSNSSNNNNNSAVVECSLKSLRPKTDAVYSMMIKRRETTCAVVFRDGTSETLEKHVTVEKFMMNKTSAVLQLKLENITCADRGDYSCKIAIRRSYRNLQLGPVISPLKVIGEPSNVVSFSVHPQNTVHIAGETVRVMCSTLQRERVNGWTWFLANQSVEDDQSERCDYSNDDCLYKCSSTISHHVSMDDEDAQFSCGINGMSSYGKLDVTNATTTIGPTSSNTTQVHNALTRLFIGDENSSETEMYILFGTLSLVFVIIISFTLILISGRFKSTSEPLRKADLTYVKVTGLGMPCDQIKTKTRPYLLTRLLWPSKTSFQLLPPDENETVPDVEFKKRSIQIF